MALLRQSMEEALAKACSKTESDACHGAARAEILRVLLELERKVIESDDPMRTLTAARCDYTAQLVVQEAVGALRRFAGDECDVKAAAMIEETLAPNGDCSNWLWPYGYSRLACAAIDRFAGANFRSSITRDGWEVFWIRCIVCVNELERMSEETPGAGMVRQESRKRILERLRDAKRDALDWPPPHAKFAALVRELEAGRPGWALRLLPGRTLTHRHLDHLLARAKWRSAGERIVRFKEQQVLRMRHLVVVPAVFLVLAAAAVNAAPTFAILCVVAAALWFAVSGLNAFGFPFEKWSAQHAIGKLLADEATQDPELYEEFVTTGLLRVHVMGENFK